MNRKMKELTCFEPETTGIHSYALSIPQQLDSLPPTCFYCRCVTNGAKIFTNGNCRRRQGYIPTAGEQREYPFCNLHAFHLREFGMDGLLIP